MMSKTKSGAAAVTVRRTANPATQLRRTSGVGRTIRYQRVAPRPLSIALYSAFAGGVASLVLPASLAWANPQGQQVVRGSATVQTNGNTLTVTNTPGAAINWQSFSIKANETTHFQQANSASSVLNRVVANNPSELLGNLTSNGKVVLINPFGITVGKGAAVDTAGFTASTLNITDADWAKGRLRFEGNALSGDVKVDGVIRSKNGDVVLFAPNVSVGSDALIKADNGNVIIGAGQKVEVTGRGLEGIRFEIQSAGNKAVNLGKIEGNAVGVFAGTLRHSGSITAQTATMEGGKVVLRAIKEIEISGPNAVVRADGAAGKAGGQISISSATGDVLVGAGATISANGGAAANGVAAGAGGTVGIAAEQGKLTVEQGTAISANGSPAGSVRLFGATQANVAGVVTALSPVRTDSTTQIEPISLPATAIGGKVEVLGKEVNLQAGAMVDVSGDGGGGVILIGGDFQGRNPDVPNAKNTNVAPGVHLTADGRAEGDGGKVIVWADNDTHFSGTISAKGGALGGNGGFAETSGKHALYYRGRTNLTAARGTTGTLLLDPDAITIYGGTSDGTDADPDSGTINTGAGQGTVSGGTGGFTIYESEIEGTQANILLQATNSILVAGAFTGSELTIKPGYNLTLQVTNAGAGGGIDLSGSSDGYNLVLRTSFSSGNGVRGGISLQATSSTGNGNITVGSLVTDGGSVSIFGDGGVTLGLQGGGTVYGGINTSSSTTAVGGGAVSITSSGTLTTLAHIVSGTVGTGGAITLLARTTTVPNAQVNISSSLNSHGGAISATGWGINMLSGIASGHIDAGMGTVSLTGTGNSLGSFGGGVAVGYGTAVIGNQVSLTGDRIYIHSTNGTVTASSVAELKAYTANREIRLGGDDQYGTTFMGVQQAEISRIFAPTLRIGSGTAGDITLIDAVSLASGSTLSLISGGAISQTSPNFITADALAAQGASVSLASSYNNVGTFAGRATAGSLNFRNQGSFTVAAVDGVTATSAVGGLITLQAGPSSQITLASDLRTAGGGITVDADRIVIGDASVSAVTIDSNVSGTGNGGYVTLLGIITASQAGRGLTIDSSAGAGNHDGGSISIADVTNIGGAYLHKLEIDASKSGTGANTNGTVYMNGSAIELDAFASTAATLAVRNAHVLILQDLEVYANTGNATLSPGGVIDFSTARIGGDSGRYRLALYAESGGGGAAGGLIKLGEVAQFSDYIGGLTVSAQGGEIQLLDSIGVKSGTGVASDGNINLTARDISISGINPAIVSYGGSIAMTAAGGTLSIGNNVSILAQGGAGANAATPGAEAGAGGTGGNIALSADDFVVGNNTSIVSSGGAGGNGISTGGSGASGGAGGMGGNVTMTAASGSIATGTGFTLASFGGNGGFGAVGQTGSFGANAASGTAAGDGGNGLSGGGGGDGGQAGDVLMSAPALSITGYVGARGGNGGHGAAGGNGGRGGDGYEDISYTYASGSGGAGGNAGYSGRGGSGGYVSLITGSAGALVVSSAVVESAGGVGGAAVAGGPGGSAGTSMGSGGSGLSGVNGDSRTTALQGERRSVKLESLFGQGVAVSNSTIRGGYVDIASTGGLSGVSLTAAAIDADDGAYVIANGGLLFMDGSSSIFTTGSGIGNNGQIELTSDTGISMSGTLQASGAPIIIRATGGDLVVGNYARVTSQGKNGSAGAGGKISLTASSGDLTIGDYVTLYSRGGDRADLAAPGTAGDGANGGDITLTSSLGDISVGINSQVYSQGGKGGSGTSTLGAGTSGGRGGNGGDVVVNATQGTLSFATGSTVASFGGQGGMGAAGGAGSTGADATSGETGGDGGQGYLGGDGGYGGNGGILRMSAGSISINGYVASKGGTGGASGAGGAGGTGGNGYDDSTSMNASGSGGRGGDAGNAGWGGDGGRITLTNGSGAALEIHGATVESAGGLGGLAAMGGAGGQAGSQVGASGTGGPGASGYDGWDGGDGAREEMYLYSLFGKGVSLVNSGINARYIEIKATGGSGNLSLTGVAIDTQDGAYLLARGGKEIMDSSSSIKANSYGIGNNGITLSSNSGIDLGGTLKTAGGAIIVSTSAGNLTVADYTNIISISPDGGFGGDGFAGGEISLSASGGNLSIGNSVSINSTGGKGADNYSSGDTAYVGGMGGYITLHSLGTMTFGGNAVIQSTGGGGGDGASSGGGGAHGGAGGRGGDISIQADSGTLTFGNGGVINSYGGNGGAGAVGGTGNNGESVGGDGSQGYRGGDGGQGGRGGDIYLQAPALAVDAVLLSQGGVGGAGGVGGQGGAGVGGDGTTNSGSGGLGGNGGFGGTGGLGGDIGLTSDSGTATLSITGGGLSSYGGAGGLGAAGGAGGAAGVGGLPGGMAGGPGSPGVDGDFAKGGTIYVYSGGAVSVGNASVVARRATLEAAGGDLSLNAFASILSEDGAYLTASGSILMDADAYVTANNFITLSAGTGIALSALSANEIRLHSPTVYSASGFAGVHLTGESAYLSGNGGIDGNFGGPGMGEQLRVNLTGASALSADIDHDLWITSANNLSLGAITAHSADATGTISIDVSSQEGKSLVVDGASIGNDNAAATISVVLKASSDISFQNGSIALQGSGNVTLSSTAGPINLYSGASVMTDSGTLELTTPTSSISVYSGAMLGSYYGNVVLRADQVTIGGEVTALNYAGALPSVLVLADNFSLQGTLTAGSGATVALRPLSSGRDMELLEAAGNVTPGATGIRVEDIDRISAGTLQLGNADMTGGAVAFRSAVNPSTGPRTLAVYGTSITQESGAPLSLDGLMAMASGSVTLAHGTNEIGTLAGGVTGSGDFTVSTSSTVTVGAVAGVSGISTGTGGRVTLDAGGDINLGSSDPITAGSATLVAGGSINASGTSGTMIDVAGALNLRAGAIGSEEAPIRFSAGDMVTGEVTSGGLYLYSVPAFDMANFTYIVPSAFTVSLGTGGLLNVGGYLDAGDSGSTLTLYSDAAAGIEINAGAGNTGTVAGTGGTLKLVGNVTVLNNHEFNAKVEHSAGNWVVTSNASASFNVAENAFDNFTLSSGSANFASGDSTVNSLVISSGTVALGGGNLTVSNGDVTNNGTLKGSGTLTFGESGKGLYNNGTISPGGNGTAGTLNIAGNLFMEAGTVQLDWLSGSHDKLDVSGDLVLSGNINVTEVGTPFISVNDSIAALAYGGTLTDNGATLNAGTGVVFAFDTTAEQKVGIKASSVYNSWTLGGSGNYNDAGNWLRLHAPTLGEDVTITNGGSAYTVFLNGTMGYARTLTVSGDVVLSIGGVGSGLSLAPGGTSTLSGLTLGGYSALASGGATVDVNGVLTIKDGFHTFDNITLRHNNTSGASVWQATAGSSWIDLQNGARFANTVGSTLGITTSSANTAILRSTNSGGLDEFVNSGTLDVGASGGTVYLGSTFQPMSTQLDGVININAGRLEIGGTLNSVNAFITATPGTTLALGGGATSFTNTSQLLGNGLFLVENGASATIASGATRTLLTGGTVALNSGSLKMDSTAALTLNNKLTLNIGTLDTAGALALNGGFDWTYGTVKGSGAITVGGVLNMSGAGSLQHALDGRTLTLNDTSGSSNWNSGTSNFNFLTLSGGAEFAIGAGGKLNIGGDGTFGFFDDGAASTFRNQGLITKTGASTFFAGSNGYTQFINTGTINVQGGVFSLDAATNSFTGGSINVAGGTTFRTTANRSFTNSGTVSGAGTIAVGTGTFTNNGTLSPGGSGAAGTLTIAGNLNMAGGTVKEELFSTLSFDSIHVTGNIITGGTLAVSENAPFALVGDSFNVLTWTTGTVTGSTLATPAGDVGYSLTAGSNALSLGINSVINRWATDTSLNWQNAGSNWSRGHLPTAAEDVVIDRAAAATTVSISSGAAINVKSLNVLGDDVLIIMNPATTVTLGTGNSSLSNLYLTDGTLLLGGTLTSIGNFTQSAGTLKSASGGAEAVSHTGTANFSNSAKVELAFGSTGTINSTGAGAIFAGGGSLTGASSKLNVGNSGSVRFTGGTFSLTDSIVVGNADGTSWFTVSSGANVGLYGTGSLNLLNINLDGASGSPQLTLGNSGGNNVLSYLQSGANSQLAGGSALHITGAFNWTGGTMASGGTTYVTVATAANSYISTTGVSTVLDRALENDGQMKVYGTGALTITALGSLVNMAGNTLSWTPGGAVATSGSDSGTIYNNGLLDFNSTIASSMAGVLQNGSTGELRISGGKLDLLSTINSASAGVINLMTAGSALGLANNFTIASTGSVKGIGTIGTTAGRLYNLGTISPGNTAIGTLTVAGNYTQGATGVLSARAGAGSTSDRLNVTGDATLVAGAQLTLGNHGGYTIANGNAFIPINTGSGLAGTFNVTVSQSGVTLTPAYGALQMTLTASGGAANTWTGAAGDNNWATAGNWSLGHAPVSGDIVVISPAGAKTITLSTAAANISSLTMGDTDDTLVLVGGGSLVLPGSSSLGGTLEISGAGGMLTNNNAAQSIYAFSISGGTLANYGSITAGSLLINGGTITGGGTLNVSGAVTWNNGGFNGQVFNTAGIAALGVGSRNLTATTWNMSGTVNSANSGLLYLDGSTINTAPGSVWNESGTQSAMLSITAGTNAFNNGGTLNWLTAAPRGVAYNDAIFSFNNTGSVNIAAGALMGVQANGVDTGTWTINGTLEAGGGTRTQTGGAYSGTGLLKSVAGSLQIGAGTAFGLDSTGTLNIVSGGFTLATGTAQNFVNAVTVSTAGGFETSDNVSFGDLVVNNATLSGTGNKQAVNLTLTNGSIAGGTLTTSGNSSIAGTSTSLSNLRWINNGTLADNGTTIAMSAATLVNSSGAVLNVQGSGGTGWFGVTGSAIVNDGTVNWGLGSGVRAISANTALTNNGTINVTGGTMDVASGSFSQLGTLAVGTGATFNRASGFTNAGLLAGAGTVVTSNASLTNSGTIKSAGFFNLNGGTLFNTGTLSPGGSGAAGTLAVSGNVNLTGGMLLVDLVSAGQNDKIVISGAGGLVKGGTLSASESAPFIAGGDAFSIITYSNGSGSIGQLSTSIPDVTLTLGTATGNLQVIAAAVTNRWKDGISGSWDTASSWTRGHAPNAFEDAVINPLTTETVTVSSGTQLARSLAMAGDDRLLINGGTLQLAAASTIGSGATLALSSGSIAGAGALNVAGIFNWSGGSVDLTGTLGTAGNVVLAGGNKYLNSTWNAGAGIVDYTAGNLFISATGAMGIGSGATLNVVTADSIGSDIRGAGSFSAASGSVVNMNSPLGSNSIYTQVVNLAGTVNLLNGEWDFDREAPGTTINLSGTVNMSNGTRIKGYSTLGGPAVVFNVNSGGSFNVVSGTAFLDMNGWDLNANTALSLPAGLVLNQSAGTLTAASSLGVGAAYNLSGGTLAGGGNASVSGNFNWSGGTVTGGGTLATSGTTDIGGTAAILDGRTWSNSGAATWQNGETITLKNGAVINNTAAGQMVVGNVTGTGIAAGTGGGSIINAGQFFTSGTVATGGGNFSNSGTLQGNGLINLGTGTLSSTGAIKPGGTGAVGTLAVTGNADLSGGTLYGELFSSTSYDKLSVSGNLKSGGTLAFAEVGSPFVAISDAFDLVTWGGAFNGTLPSLSGSISGASMTLANTGGALRLSAASILNSWLSANLSGAWDTGTNWSRGHAPTAGESISVDAGGNFTVTVASGASGLGMLTLGGDDTLIFTGGNFVLPSASSIAGTLSLMGGTLTNSGSALSVAALNWLAGTIGGTGSISTSALGLAGSGTRSLTGSTLAAVGGTTLGSGSLQLLGGAFDWTSGTFTVGSGSSLAIDGGAIGSGAFLNQGVVAVGTAAGTLTTLGGVGTQTGSFGIATGKTLSLGSGNVTLASSAAIVGGTWDVSAGQVTVAGTINRGNGGATRISGGTLNVAGALVTDSLDLSSGLLNGTGDLTVNTAFSQGSGTLGASFDDVSITQSVGDLTVGAVSGNSVTLAALSGSLKDGNSGLTNVTASSVKLRAASGIDLDLNTPLLDAVMTSAGEVDLTNAGALQLATLSAASGNVSLAVSGALTQSGAVQVGGSMALGTGGAGVTLTNAGNQFGGVITLVGVGATQIRDNGNLSVAGSSLGLTLDSDSVTLGTLAVTGPLVITATGQINQGSSISVSGLTSLNAADIVLTTASTYSGGVTFNTTGSATLNSSGSLVLGGTANHAGGNLSLTASGPVSQTAALNVGGTAAVSAAGQSINFGSLSNDFNAVSFTASSVQVKDINTLSIGGNVSGNVAVTAATGVNSWGSLNFGSLGVTLTGTGSLALSDGNVAGATSFATSGAGAYQDISYTNNSSTGSLGGPILAAGTVSLSFKNAGLALPQMQAATLVVGAGGALTQTGAITAGRTTLAAIGHDVTLNNAGNHLGSLRIEAHDASLTDAGTLSLSGELAGALHVSAANISQVPADALKAASATLSAASGIAMIGANELGTLAASSGGAITVNDVGTQLMLDLISTPGSLAVQSGGALVQKTGGSLSSASLDLLALSIGSETQPMEFTAPTARLYAFAGNVAAHSAQAFSLTGLGATGNASVSSSQALLVTGAAEAGGALSLAGQGLSVQAQVDAANVSLNSGAGTLAIGGGGGGGGGDGGTAPVEVFGRSSVALLGRDITLLGGSTQGARAEVVSDGSISVNAAGNFVIHGGAGTGALAQVTSYGPLSVTVGGALDVIGGAGAGAYAKLDPAVTSLMSVNAQSVTLQGGSGAGAYAGLVSEGDITVVAPGGITMVAGTGADADAVVVSYFGKVTLPNCNGCVKLSTPPFGNGIADVGVMGGEEYLTVLTGNVLGTNELVQLQNILTALVDKDDKDEKAKKKEKEIVIEGQVCN